jgi:betaine-aldehyde dehydrogenase
VEHRDPAMISMTGSTRAGSQVAATAARDLKRVHLELGGNAPVLVFADAEIEYAAAKIADGAYFNGGQDCTAATRVLVTPGFSQEFCAELTRVAKATRVGPVDDDAAIFGPLNNATQFSRLKGLVERIPDRARVLTGGRPIGSRGFYFEPTIVSGLHNDDEIVREEIFGPVITIQEFSDEAEAVALANSVEYGLAASVWTRDHARAMRVSRALDFGCVWVNTHASFISEMPHGGFKKSGYGKDLSLYGFDDYTRIKHVMHALRE